MWIDCLTDWSRSIWTCLINWGKMKHYKHVFQRLRRWYWNFSKDELKSNCCSHQNNRWLWRTRDENWDWDQEDVLFRLTRFYKSCRILHATIDACQLFFADRWRGRGAQKLEPLSTLGRKLSAAVNLVEADTRVRHCDFALAGKELLRSNDWI